ncbi:hypothetical protein D3C85_1344320 [compost metagenome]
MVVGTSSHRSGGGFGKLLPSYCLSATGLFSSPSQISCTVSMNLDSGAGSLHHLNSTRNGRSHPSLGNRFSSPPGAAGRTPITSGGGKLIFGSLEDAKYVGMIIPSFSARRNDYPGGVPAGFLKKQHHVLTCTHAKKSQALKP